MQAATNKETVLSLDVGEKRIGVARSHLSINLPSPLTTLQHPERFTQDIKDLCKNERAAALVIGLPRSLSGEETPQTATVRKFGASLELELDIPVYWVDEAVTSRQAEAELLARGKPYSKSDIDALAAVYILEDFLRDNPEFHG